MSPIVIWALLIAAQAAINLPFVLYLLKQRISQVTVSSQAQAIVDSLTTATANLPTALSNASAAAGTQATEDLAAIQTAASNLVTAINNALPPAQEPTETEQVQN